MGRHDTLLIYQETHWDIMSHRPRDHEMVKASGTKRYRGTSWEAMRYQETPSNTVTYQEHHDIMKHQETSRHIMINHKISCWDIVRHPEIPSWNTQQQTLWNTIRDSKRHVLWGNMKNQYIDAMRNIPEPIDATRNIPWHQIPRDTMKHLETLINTEKHH